MHILRLRLVAFAVLAAGCQTSPQRFADHDFPGRQVNQAALATIEDGSERSVRQAQHSEGDPNESIAHDNLEPLPEQTLGLADLEELALATNPSITKERALVEAARGNWLQVGLPPNPSLGYEGQQIGSRGLAEQDGVFVGQEFVRGGKLRLNREVAAQEVAKAEQQLMAQEWRVRTDVRIAFYRVLIAQRQFQLATDLQKVAGENLKAAESLERGKEVGQIDVVQAQLELENVRILLENARNRERAAWRTLASVVGDSELPSKSLVGDVEEERDRHEWQPTLARLLSTSPEIAAQMAEVDRARWAAERARVEKTPNLTVQGLINVRDNGIGGRSDGSLTVGVPLPLWNRNQGAIVQTAQAAVAAERALQQLELALQNRLVPVFERYSNALNQASKYRDKILPGALRALELAKATYQAGETSYVNLLTAQRTYSQTNLNYLESLRELREAEAQIEGLLLSGSLETR
jgi:cobalt-zinc-cadmium efflux system outer membrane protein